MYSIDHEIPLDSPLQIGEDAMLLFRDCARKKWPLKGSMHADNLMSQIIGLRCSAGAEQELRC